MQARDVAVLTDEAFRFYGLVMGEGWLFPLAKLIFWDQFDRLWRKALSYVSDHSSGLNQAAIDQYLDQQLLNRLRIR